MFSQKDHCNGIIHLGSDFIYRLLGVSIPSLNGSMVTTDQPLIALTGCELIPPLCLLVCTFNPCRELLVT